MRVGLIGRVWVSRRVEVCQAVPFSRKYMYLAVVIDPLTGRLWWEWQASMKGTEMTRIWQAWAAERDIDGWVWEGGRGHKGKDVQAVDAPQVVQPPYAPELNPVERFFRDLHRAIEGRVYPGLQAKKDALKPVLNAWQTDPERVRRLCGRDWIRKALEALPDDAEVT